MPRSLKITLAFPLAAAALTLVSIVFAVSAWAKRYWRVRHRSAYTLVVLTSLAPEIAWVEHLSDVAQGFTALRVMAGLKACPTSTRVSVGVALLVVPDHRRLRGSRLH